MSGAVNVGIIVNWPLLRGMCRSRSDWMVPWECHHFIREVLSAAAWRTDSGAVQLIYIFLNSNPKAGVTLGLVDTPTPNNSNTTPAVGVRLVFRTGVRITGSCRQEFAVARQGFNILERNDPTHFVHLPLSKYEARSEKCFCWGPTLKHQIKPICFSITFSQSHQAILYVNHCLRLLTVSSHSLFLHAGRLRSDSDDRCVNIWKIAPRDLHKRAWFTDTNVFLPFNQFSFKPTIPCRVISLNAMTTCRFQAVVKVLIPTL